MFKTSSSRYNFLKKSRRKPGWDKILSTMSEVADRAHRENSNPPQRQTKARVVSSDVQVCKVEFSVIDQEGTFTTPTAETAASEQPFASTDTDTSSPKWVADLVALCDDLERNVFGDAQEPPLKKTKYDELLDVDTTSMGCPLLAAMILNKDEGVDFSKPLLSKTLNVSFFLFFFFLSHTFLFPLISLI